MKYLVVIPARGGSKGIPGKNIKKLQGKPLIHYTLEAAKAIFSERDICVSTDSTAIARVVETIGLEIPFIRPADLASDKSGMYEVLLHALGYYEQKYNVCYDAIVLLQPTSPLRKEEHIKEAIELFDKSIDMVVSVTESKANPYYNLFEENNKGYLKKSKPSSFVRRQDLPKVWEYNGAIYIINTRSLKERKLQDFKKIVKYPMLPQYALDLDTMEDWKYLEYLMNEK